MARISILEPRIRELVDRKLVPLFLAERSTAALCKSLNRVLQGAGGGTIHPNRLHALLSDDVSRGANDATVSMVEEAVRTLESGHEDWVQRAEKHLEELRAEVRHLREAGRLSYEDILKRLALPPA